MSSSSVWIWGWNEKSLLLPAMSRRENSECHPCRAGLDVSPLLPNDPCSSGGTYNHPAGRHHGGHAAPLGTPGALVHIRLGAAWRLGFCHSADCISDISWSWLSQKGHGDLWISDWCQEAWSWKTPFWLPILWLFRNLTGSLVQIFQIAWNRSNKKEDETLLSSLIPIWQIVVVDVFSSATCPDKKTKSWNNAPSMIYQCPSTKSVLQLVVSRHGSGDIEHLPCKVYISNLSMLMDFFGIAIFARDFVQLVAWNYRAYISTNP